MYFKQLLNYQSWLIPSLKFADPNFKWLLGYYLYLLNLLWLYTGAFMKPSVTHSKNKSIFM